MNRKVVFLNLLLIALVVWMGWLVRTKWLEAEARQREVLSQNVKAAAIAQAGATPNVPRAVAADYLDVAQRTLFAKDRNPNVAIEAPPPPAPPPPVPPFPIYHGQMAFGEPVLVLSTGQGEMKSYHKGETVGKFKLVDFDREKVTLDWDGKILEQKLSDLAPKEAAQQVAQAQAPVSTPAPAASGVTALGGGNSQSRSLGDNTPQLGTDMGGFRACVPGDNSPAGTVLNGFKKVITQGLMGQSCHWEPAK